MQKSMGGNPLILSKRDNPLCPELLYRRRLQDAVPKVRYPCLSVGAKHGGVDAPVLP